MRAKNRTERRRCHFCSGARSRPCNISPAESTCENEEQQDSVKANLARVQSRRTKAIGHVHFCLPHCHSFRLKSARAHNSNLKRLFDLHAISLPSKKKPTSFFPSFDASTSPSSIAHCFFSFLFLTCCWQGPRRLGPFCAWCRRRCTPRA